MWIGIFVNGYCGFKDDRFYSVTNMNQSNFICVTHVKG